MPRIDNANPPRFTIPGVEFTAVAAPSRGTGETAVWRASVAPGSDGAIHQMTREEIIVAVAGKGTIRIAGEAHRLVPGDAFAVPPFTDFQVGSTAAAPFEAIFILPAGARAVVAGQPAFQPPWSV